MRLKKIFRGWVVLSCAFLACGSAAGVGNGFCFRLDGLGDIEGHQAMIAHARGNQLIGEVEKQIVVFFGSLKPLAVLFDDALFQSDNNNAVIVICANQTPSIALHMLANDREKRAFELEQIPDPNLNLSVLIAQDHLSLSPDLIKLCRRPPRARLLLRVHFQPFFHRHEPGAERPSWSMIGTKGQIKNDPAAYPFRQFAQALSIAPTNPAAAWSDALGSFPQRIFQTMHPPAGEIPLAQIGHETVKNPSRMRVTGRKVADSSLRIIHSSPFGNNLCFSDLCDRFNLDQPVVRVHGHIGNFDSRMWGTPARQISADHDILLPVTLSHERQQAGRQLFHSQTIPSLRITALRYRQLYRFQNQFISRIKISCLRDARHSTSVTQSGSISCLRTLVLSTYGPRTLPPRSGIAETGWSARRRFIQTNIRSKLCLS